MPAWQPDWTNVRFDHAACEVAVAACRLAASQLEGAADAQVAAGDRARTDWTGATEERFTEAAGDVVADQRTLTAELEALALALEAGAEAATEEQEARERDRERWREERDAEVAAERARREEQERIAAGGPV